MSRASAHNLVIGAPTELHRPCGQPGFLPRARAPLSAAGQLAMTHILRARRQGAIYEENFRVLGPGIAPRQLAGNPWRVSLPPGHCKALRETAAAVRNGDPLPMPPVEGWARQDLMHVREGLWHHWGIAVHIQAEEDGQAAIGPDFPNF